MTSKLATPHRSATREAPYKERLQTLAAFWHLEHTPHVHWTFNFSPSNIPLLDEDLSYPAYFQDKKVQLAEQLEAIRLVEGLGIDDLFIPHLQPQMGVTIFASAFGCQVEYPENTYPQNRSLISNQDSAEKVYDLVQPGITDYQLGEVLDLIDYFIAQTNCRYPIQLTDLQSPIDTALLIWNTTTFMLEMYDHPEAVHHLMRMITDLTIAFTKEHRKRSSEFMPISYPAVWSPEDMGLGISDDALAVLSPKTYEEFALPYLNELSEEFNGIFIHSCGNIVHQIENLDKVHNLRGINFGATETPFEAVWERFNGKIAIVPHLGLNKDIYFETQIEYARHIQQVKTHNRGLLIIFSPEKISKPKLEAKVLNEFVNQVHQLIEEE